MKKRVFAFLAIFLMSAIVGCSGEAVVPEFIVGSNDTLDMGGMTFTFASEWNTEWYATEELPTAAVEKMMNRFEETATEFNFDFVMYHLENVSELTNAIAAGDPLPEMIDVNAVDGYDLYTAGLLLPLSKLPDVNLEDTKWGTANFIYYGNYNGEQYGFFPWDWEIVPQVNGVLMFNEELIATFGGTRPYEFQENGTWNWDTFESELPKYSTVLNDVVYTSIDCTDLTILAKAAMHSNGAYAVEGDESSGYSCGYDAPKGYAALEYANRIYKNNYIYVGSITDFTQEKTSAFFVGESYYGTVFNPNDTSQDEFCSTNLDDYGFITFPTGPNGTENDVGSFTFTNRRLNYITAYSNMENTDISTIISYMFEPLANSQKEGWKAFSKSQLFLSDESYNNFVNIIEKTAYDYSIQLQATSDVLNNNLKEVVRGAKTPATAFSAIKEALQKAINEFTKIG